MPNVMTALPNIGGALCLTPQSSNLAEAHYCRVPCSNAAKAILYVLFLCRRYGASFGGGITRTHSKGSGNERTAV